MTRARTRRGDPVSFPWGGRDSQISPPPEAAATRNLHLEGPAALDKESDKTHNSRSKPLGPSTDSISTNRREVLSPNDGRARHHCNSSPISPLTRLESDESLHSLAGKCAEKSSTRWLDEGTVSPVGAAERGAPQPHFKQLPPAPKLGIDPESRSGRRSPARSGRPLPSPARGRAAAHSPQRRVSAPGSPGCRRHCRRTREMASVRQEERHLPLLNRQVGSGSQGLSPAARGGWIHLSTPHWQRVTCIKPDNFPGNSSLDRGQRGPRRPAPLGAAGPARRPARRSLFHCVTGEEVFKGSVTLTFFPTRFGVF